MSDNRTNDAVSEQTVDEATAAYYGEWILMRVTARNDRHEPERGVVIAHSPSRSAISTALGHEPKRTDLPPGAPAPSYYTFNAFPRVRPGETIEQARRRFASQLAAAKEARVAAQ